MNLPQSNQQHENKSLSRPNNGSQDQQSTQEDQSNTSKKGESGVDVSQKIISLIEQRDYDQLNELLDKEVVSKRTLTLGLCLALQNYKHNMLDIIGLLLARGAFPNSNFRTITKTTGKKIEEKDKVSLLMYVCELADILIVDLFLKPENNININAVDKYNKNALFYAILADGDNVAVINHLIMHGINVNCEGKVENSNGNYTTHTPLTLAASRNIKNTFESILKGGANVNFKTKPEEDTALHIAVRNSYTSIISILLSSPGVSYEEKNKEGKTPLALAAENAETEIYETLFSKIKSIKQKEEDSATELITDEEKKQKMKMEIETTHNLLGSPSLSSTPSSSVNNTEQNEQTETPTKPNDSEKSESSGLYNKKKKADKKQNPTLMKLHSSPPKSETANKIYKYLNHNKPNISWNIPIHFQKNGHQNTPGSGGLGNNLNSYISFSTIKDPILNIEISEDAIETEQKVSNLQKELDEKNDQLGLAEKKNSGFKNELEKLKLENAKLREQFQQQEILLKEAETKIQYDNSLIKEFKKEKEELQKQYGKLLKECTECQTKLQYYEQAKINNSLNSSITNPNSPTTLTQYLNKKFVKFTYAQDYLLKCLSKDIIDYQQFVTEHIQREQNVYKHLIQNIQNSVNESIRDYDVCLYGSHATNLCLPCSDLDVVLIPRNPQMLQTAASIHNPAILTQLYENIRKQPWVKESKIIPSASIPIIKLISKETFNSMSIDISIQDEKHFGLKCVELVKRFINSYESLKPLVLALKNILKKANLNDPYKGGMSSYGLILMIVSFLQTQKRAGKDISINESNLGRLFYEFVNYYGLAFEPSNYIILARINENDDTNDFTAQVSFFF